MKRFGVGVIGLGVGAQHARAFAALAECEVRWLCDVDRPRAEQLAQEIATARVTTNDRDVLEDPSTDIVVVASYDDAHFAQVRAALMAGKHVFAEKPLCRSSGELAILRNCWHRHGGRVVLMSNLVLRAAPLYKWLRQSIREGRLGRVYAWDGEYLYGRLEKITHGWRKDVPNYSVMQGGGIHLLDLLLWTTGELPKRVMAAGNRICTENTAFRYLDFVTTLLEFPSGMIGRITANFGCVHRHQHVVRVYGTKSTLLYDDAGPRMHTCRDPHLTPERLDASPLPRTKGDLVPGFVSAICEGQDVREETELMFGTLQVCFACDEAVRTGQTVEIVYS